MLKYLNYFYKFWKYFFRISKLGKIYDLFVYYINPVLLLVMSVLLTDLV